MWSRRGRVGLDAAKHICSPGLQDVTRPVDRPPQPARLEPRKPAATPSAILQSARHQQWNLVELGAVMVGSMEEWQAPRGEVGIAGG